MTLARISNNEFPSFPSFFNRFFEGDMLDWSSSNFAGVNPTLPAINVRENDEAFLIDVAAPGMKKEDFKVNFDNGRLTISSEIKDEMSEIDIKKAVILAVSPKAAEKLEKADEIYINARFDSAIETLDNEEDVAQKNKETVTDIPNAENQDKKDESADNARSKMVQNLENAWKGDK